MQKLFIGADVSKGYIDAIILDSKGTHISSTEKFYDTAVGHSKFSDWVKAVLTPNRVIYVGVESTGGYENNWISLFRKIARLHNVHYVQLNPRAVSNSSKALLKRTITDGVSAAIIADYMIRYFDRILFDTDDSFSSLRRLWSSRELSKKAHVSHWIHLQLILYDANPTILRYTRDRLPSWVLTVLKNYPTAKKLAQARAGKLSKIPYVTISRANELISAAKESVAADSEECTEFLIRQSVDILLDLSKQIKAIELRLIKEGENFPDVNLLCTIPGIGEITAVGLVINIGDIRRFENVKKLTSYFGLHPMFKESGDGKTVARMSKVGRKRPRTMLFNAVFGGIRANPILKRTYDKCIKAGKAHKSAMGVCMHQLLRIVYGVMTSGESFDIEIHNKHKEKGDTSKSAVVVTLKPVEMADEYSAPISAKEARRLKDREAESQNCKSNLVRDHQPPIH